MTIVVNPGNDWLDCITTEELKTIWEPEAQNVVTNWRQVRDGFPDRSLKLYGAGTDSGTFDYFTEVINGKSRASRGDYTASEDDNTLVQGLSGDRNGLGYLGLAYYEQNSEKLKAVAVDSGSGCIEPTAANVENGSYTPLSRPLLIYVNRAASERPEVSAFIDFYLNNAAFLAEDVGYIPLTDRIAEAITARWRTRTTGSLFTEGQHGIPLRELIETN
jgi:phosphate transport system substrate-binding protein